jgi:excisionase family DNA binding protein
MDLYSTNEAAKRLGIGLKTLSRYIADKKVPPPRFLTAGKSTFHAWTEEEIEVVRKLLPKIANGRKTRWQRQREGQKKKATKSQKK